MSLYYQDEHVTLYHGDCLQLANVWNSADVLVTDPPYGTQAMSGNPRGGYGRRQNKTGTGSPHAPSLNGQGAVIANDLDTHIRDTVLTLWGPNRPAIVFGSPRLGDPPGLWDDRLVWDKKRPGMNGGPFRYSHESIFARGMTRANNSTFSVFSVYPDQTDHIHAKPLSLMEALIYTCPEGLIADPFSGSGSTLVAARNLGRHAVGVELDERYCEIIANRFAQDVLPLGF